MDPYPACPETGPRAAKPKGSKTESDGRTRTDKEQEAFNLAASKGNSNVHNVKKNAGKATLSPRKSRFIKCTKMVLPKGNNWRIFWSQGGQYMH